MNKKSSVVVLIIIICLILIIGLGVKTTDSGSKNSSSSNSKDLSYTRNKGNILLMDKSKDIENKNSVIETKKKINVGSKKELEQISKIENFDLKSNFISETIYIENLNALTDKKISKIFLYFDVEKKYGNNDLIINLNEQNILKDKVENLEFPISIQTNFEENELELRIEKPRWFSFFNWNKYFFNNFKIVVMSQPTQGNKKSVYFDYGHDVNDVVLNTKITCLNFKQNEKIEMFVNGFKITNGSRYINCKNDNEFNLRIDRKKLNQGTNTITFETGGYFEIEAGVRSSYKQTETEYFFDYDIEKKKDAELLIYSDKEFININLNGYILQIKNQEKKNVTKYLIEENNKLDILDEKIYVQLLKVEYK